MSEYDVIEKWIDKQRIEPSMREWMLYIYNTDANYWGSQSLWKLFDYCTENSEYHERTNYA